MYLICAFWSSIQIINNLSGLFPVRKIILRVTHFCHWWCPFLSSNHKIFFSLYATKVKGRENTVTCTFLTSAVSEIISVTDHQVTNYLMCVQFLKVSSLSVVTGYLHPWFRYFFPYKNPKQHKAIAPQSSIDMGRLKYSNARKCVHLLILLACTTSNFSR